MKTVRMEDMNWPDINEAITKEEKIISMYPKGMTTRDI